MGNTVFYLENSKQIFFSFFLFFNLKKNKEQPFKIVK